MHCAGSSLASSQLSTRALALLEFLRGIESALGRPGIRDRSSPRSIDLDILYAGDLVLTGASLIVPHPRLHLRRFVLEPLAGLRPDLVLPGFHQTVRQLLVALPDSVPLAVGQVPWQEIA